MPLILPSRAAEGLAGTSHGRRLTTPAGGRNRDNAGKAPYGPPDKSGKMPTYPEDADEGGAGARPDARRLARRPARRRTRPSKRARCRYPRAHRSGDPGPPAPASATLGKASEAGKVADHDAAAAACDDSGLLPGAERAAYGVEGGARELGEVLARQGEVDLGAGEEPRELGEAAVAGLGEEGAGAGRR